MSNSSNRNTTFLLIGILAVFSWQVAQGLLVPLDRVVAGWAVSSRSPLLDPLMRMITFFGSSVWTIVALALLSEGVWQRRGRTITLAYLTVFALGFVVEIVLRLLVAQWRPDALSVPSSMDWHMRFELAGFPSGHAYRSAVTFGWVMAEVDRSRWGTVVRWVSLAMIVLVGVSRLYLNRHWASDVIGSWFLATTVLLLAQIGAHSQR